MFVDPDLRRANAGRTRTKGNARMSRRIAAARLPISTPVERGPGGEVPDLIAEDERTLVRMSRIRADGGTQARAGLDPATVTDYAERMAAGDTFPPISLVYDGADYWLVDGFHRLEAAREGEATHIHAIIAQGTRRDAVLASVGVNAVHGLRRSNDDKRRAVKKLLEDPEWQQWSDREIARRCAVSDRMVNQLRTALSANNSHMPRTVTAKRGDQTYTLTVPARKPEPVAANPNPFALDMLVEDEDAVTYKVVGLAGETCNLREWRGGQATGDIIPRHYKSLHASTAEESVGTPFLASVPSPDHPAEPVDMVADAPALPYELGTYERAPAPLNGAPSLSSRFAPPMPTVQALPAAPAAPPPAPAYRPPYITAAVVRGFAPEIAAIFDFLNTLRESNQVIQAGSVLVAFEAMSRKNMPLDEALTVAGLLP